MPALPINGGCSKKKKSVGFQFEPNANGKCYLVGSFKINGDIGYGDEEEITGDFRYGQGYRGCRECGNKYIYQCHNCGSFNCYDGMETCGLECPNCGEFGNVPATPADSGDAKIVASSGITEVILAIDVSASMNEYEGGRTRLEEVKSAAVNNFVRAIKGIKTAVVTFGTSVDTVLDFTTDANAVENAVKGLIAKGGTASPLAHIRRSFADYAEKLQGANRYIVVFTDGEWAGSGHETTAKKLRDDGVSIITIGCAGADKRFLENIATQGASIEVSGNDFESAFATVAKKVSQ